MPSITEQLTTALNLIHITPKEWNACAANSRKQLIKANLRIAQRQYHPDTSKAPDQNTKKQHEENIILLNDIFLSTEHIYSYSAGVPDEGESISNARHSSIYHRPPTPPLCVRHKPLDKQLYNAINTNNLNKARMLLSQDNIAIMLTKHNFHTAIDSGNIEIATLLFSQLPRFFRETQKAFQLDCLERTIELRQVEMFDYLLQLSHSAPYLALESTDCTSLLGHAIHQKTSSQIVATLLNQGADPNQESVLCPEDITRPKKYPLVTAMQNYYELSQANGRDICNKEDKLQTIQCLLHAGARLEKRTLGYVSLLKKVSFDTPALIDNLRKTTLIETFKSVFTAITLAAPQQQETTWFFWGATSPLWEGKNDDELYSIINELACNQTYQYSLLSSIPFFPTINMHSNKRLEMKAATLATAFIEGKIDNNKLLTFIDREICLTYNHSFHSETLAGVIKQALEPCCSKWNGDFYQDHTDKHAFRDEQDPITNSI